MQQHWSRGALREIRALTEMLRVPDALVVAQQGVKQAMAEGDVPVWRRFMCEQASILLQLGRLEEAVLACDDVVESAEADRDVEVMAQAWNVSALAADRLSRHDDALRRLDGALAVGELVLREQARLDVLGKAACSAGNIGLLELGDTIFNRVMGDIDDGTAGSFSPAALLWMRGQHILVRLWMALEMEHTGTPGHERVYEECLAMCRRVLDASPEPPAGAAAVFRGAEAFSLVVLGRVDEAREPMEQAARALPDQPYQMLIAGIELNLGMARLRSEPPADLDALRRETARLVGFAQRLGDRRWEAEIWRQAGARAADLDDPMQVVVARERFDELLHQLDWRSRVDTAQILTFRSETLRNVAEGRAWWPVSPG